MRISKSLFRLHIHAVIFDVVDKKITENNVDGIFYQFVFKQPHSLKVSNSLLLSVCLFTEGFIWGRGLEGGG